MSDSTENIRREMIASDQPRKDLRAAVERYDTQELQRNFEVLAFASPFVIARRRSDGVKGSLEFTHSPRVYFNFEVTR